MSFEQRINRLGAVFFAVCALFLLIWIVVMAMQNQTDVESNRRDARAAAKLTYGIVKLCIDEQSAGVNDALTEVRDEIEKALRDCRIQCAYVNLDVSVWSRSTDADTIEYTAYVVAHDVGTIPYVSAVDSDGFLRTLDSLPQGNFERICVME